MTSSAEFAEPKETFLVVLSALFVSMEKQRGGWRFVQLSLREGRAGAALTNLLTTVRDQ